MLPLFLVCAFVAGCSAQYAPTGTGYLYDPLAPIYIDLPVIPNPPASLDWRNMSKVFKPPYPQENSTDACHSCWTFTSTGVLESQYAIVNNLRADDGTLVAFSKQQLIDCAYLAALPNHYTSGCSGGWALHGFNYVANYAGGLFKDYPNGYPYPYSAVKVECDAVNSTDPTKFVPLKIKTYGYITPLKQYDTFPDSAIDQVEAVMINALQYGPIAVRVNYYGMTYNASRFFNCDTVAALSPNCTADHAMLCVGYTPDYWIIRNSYGPGWANSTTLPWEGSYIKVARHANSCAILCKPAVAILENNPYWPTD